MGRSILFVDDDADTRSMIELALRLHAFEITLAANSFDALEAISTRKFDLLLLDNWMPDMTGLELCRKVRELDRETPIVFLSGAGRYEDRTEALSAGANCYLTKPIDLDELVLCLEESLPKESAQPK